MAAATPEEMGLQFVQQYYALFDGNQRDQLYGFYQPESMLSYENEKFQGPDDIVKKLTSLTFTQIEHAVGTIDAQPSPGDGLLVFVSGTMAIDGDNPMMFSQVFNLLPLADGSGYYILNDIFRLMMG